MAKLRNLEGALKSWNFESEHARSQKQMELFNIIESLDCKAGSHTLSDSECFQLISTKCELSAILGLEERNNIQKCKLHWLKEGDENTSFFHRFLASRKRKRKLLISNLLSLSDCVLISDSEIEAKILSFFDNLNRSRPGQRAIPCNIRWSQVSQDLNSDLIRPFSAEEIFSVISSLGKNKAPGPDGYTIEFFLSFWQSLKADFIQLFEDFYHNGHLNACLKENFMCLIKKKNDASRIKDFRPISLTTSVYKIVAKVLAERLKCVMPGIFSKYQSAFIQGRQILDPILIANEIVEEYRVKKKSDWILKIDIEKAFDSVN